MTGQQQLFQQPTPTLDDQLTELKREQRVRKEVYTRLVATGKLAAPTAAWRMACLAAAIANLSDQQAEP